MMALGGLRAAVSDRPFVVQVVGPSGSGKTRTVERAVRRLVARGLTVAVVKHSHHSPDLRGKDTSRFADAGAAVVVFASRRSFVSFRASPARLVPALPVDVVLVEGYSHRRFGGPRVRVSAPSDATACVNRIVRAAPPRPRIPSIVVDGRRRRARGPWRFVAHFLEVEGAHEVRRWP